MSSGIETSSRLRHAEQVVRVALAAVVLERRDRQRSSVGDVAGLDVEANAFARPGSNSYRCRLWKLQLQALGDETGLKMRVAQRWGGKMLELERVDVGKVDRRGAIVFHESVTLHVKDADGAAHRLNILGPVVEHVPRGGFKVLSYKDGADG